MAYPTWLAGAPPLAEPLAAPATVAAPAPAPALALACDIAPSNLDSDDMAKPPTDGPGVAATAGAGEADAAV